MTVKTANKHELKTRETRALLLAAAQTIFVRDGYEGAELGEIAALAGRTKGAIYAQFKSKEDIFFALIEEQTQSNRTAMKEHLANATTVEENIAALRSVYLKRACDPEWSLLLLEFKLYAMRHPESKKRLHERYAGIVAVTEEERFAGFLGPAPRGKGAVSRVAAVHSLQPLIAALVLEAQLETVLSDKTVLRNITNKVFDALIAPPPRSPRQ